VSAGIVTEPAPGPCEPITVQDDDQNKDEQLSANGAVRASLGTPRMLMPTELAAVVCVLIAKCREPHEPSI
jgi:hypothetical protein